MNFDNHIGTGDPAFIQFENVDEGRAYPFADDSSRVSESGDPLPDNFISDLRLVIPTGCTAYLSSAYISSHMTSACFRIEDSSGLFSSLSVRVGNSDLEPGVPYRLEKLYGSVDSGGAITFGGFPMPDSPRSYRFSRPGVKISECAVARFVPSGLRSIIDPRTGESVAGDVKMGFSAYVTASRSGNDVNLSLKDGAAEQLMSDCVRERPSNPCGAIPIQTINGVYPDSENRIVIWFH